MNDPRWIWIGLGVIAAIWIWLRWRSPRPEFAPLQTAPDDPLMLAALDKARASLPEFLHLLEGERESALVKVRFLSSSEQVEHLWAEVLRVVEGEDGRRPILEMRLVTPPVTHAGTVERLLQQPLDQIEDWQVRDAQGRVHGAYTQRAMFAIARRDGVKLSPKLREVEQDYPEI